jgi:hypothetical protein
LDYNYLSGKVNAGTGKAGSETISGRIDDSRIKTKMEKKWILRNVILNPQPY